MRVCFYKPGAGTFASREGGVQRITQTIKSELENRGIEVILCTTSSGKKDEKDLHDLFVLPDKKEDSTLNKEALGGFLIKESIDVFVNQSAYSKTTLDLMEVVVKSNAKLINAHHNCIRCHYEHYPFIFKSNRPKWIGDLIGGLKLWPLVKAIYLMMSKRQWVRAVEQSDAFVVYFDSFVNELDDLYGIKSEKTHVITNPAAFDPLEESQLGIKKKIVYVGRIVENQKRIDKLLNLWKRIHNTYPDWTFDLVGDGPYMDTAKAFVKANKLERIVFHGFQEPEPFWINGDIFTLTSDFEGFGMVLTEAQALGTVPVAFECFSAIHEVIDHNKSGVIVPDYDEDRMFEEVKALIENPSRLMELKGNGLHKVIDFNKEILAVKWHSLFKSLLNNKNDSVG